MSTRETSRPATGGPAGTGTPDPAAITPGVPTETSAPAPAPQVPGPGRTSTSPPAARETRATNTPEGTPALRGQEWTKAAAAELARQAAAARRQRQRYTPVAARGAGQQYRSGMFRKTS